MSSINDLLNFLENLKDEFDKETNNKTSSNFTCEKQIDSSDIYQWCLIPAAVFTIIVSYFTPARQTKCGHKWFGLPVPMNVLESRRHHISFTLAFGSMFSLIYSLFTDPTSVMPVSMTNWAVQWEWASVIVNLAASIMYGACYFPIFVCIANENLVSYALGSFYIWALVIMDLLVTSQCVSHMSSISILILVFSSLPTTGCQVTLCLQFLWKTAHLLHRRRTRQPDIEEKDDYDEFCREYVQDIFRYGVMIRQAEQSENDLLEQEEDDMVKLMKNKVTQKIRKIRKELLNKRQLAFIFPPRFVATMVMSLIPVLVIFILLTYATMSVTNIFLTFLWNLLPKAYRSGAIDAYDVARKLFISYNATDDDYVFTGWYLLYTIRCCCLVSLILPLIVALTHCVLMFRTFRRNMLSLYRGRSKWISTVTDVSNSELLAGCFKYSSYQIGYMVWGFFLQFVVLLIITLFLAIPVFTPIIYGFGAFWDSFAKKVFPALGFTLAIYYAQWILARFSFLASPHQNLYITNRNAFFVFTYFIFFYNIILGMISCAVRLLKSLVFGLLLIGRLDWSVVPLRFQTSDPGYVAYLGYIHVENSHNNPTLRTFIKLLLDKHTTERRRNVQNTLENTDSEDSSLLEDSMVASYGSIEENFEVVESEKYIKHRARLRWYLTYTLLRNPTIRKYRKQNLNAKWFNTSIEKIHLQNFV